MWIRDFFGKEETMAGNGTCRIVVRFSELTGYAKAGEGSNGHESLVRLQVFAGQEPTVKSVSEQGTSGIAGNGSGAHR